VAAREAVELAQSRGRVAHHCPGEAREPLHELPTAGDVRAIVREEVRAALREAEAR
jgi:hypothetical protein